MGRKPKYGEKMNNYNHKLPNELIIYVRRLAARLDITEAEYVREAIRAKVAHDLLLTSPIITTETAGGIPTIQPEMSGRKLKLEKE